MYKHILVPIDLNEKGFADKAIKQAVWHAKHANAELHLLTVLPGSEMSLVSTYFPKDILLRMKADAKSLLSRYAEQHIDEEVVYQYYVAEGKPYETILDYAEKLGIDLIIMPSHKRSKTDNVVLGSVTEKVVQYSPINVMIVKPEG